MRIFISAGESSGDALGAALLEALERRVPALDAFGMGGARMVAGGFRAIRAASEVGVVGLVEVLRHLPRLVRLCRSLAAAAIAGRPDVAVLIDVPDFNLRLARHLKRAGIPVVFYVGPSVWAWRAHRTRVFAPWVDRMLVLFPFEVRPWADAGVDVVCVGHPLADELPRPLPEPASTTRQVALLPGSRRGEIERHLGPMLEAAALLRARKLADRFVLPVAPDLDPALLRAQLARSPVGDAVALVTQDAGDPGPRRQALADSTLALVASGTATLETALAGRPQVIVYRVSWLTYAIARLLAKVRFLGLPNLIAGREVAPELLQQKFTPGHLADAAARLLGDVAARRQVLAAYEEIRRNLGAQGAAERAAEAVTSLVLGPNSRPLC